MRLVDGIAATPERARGNVADSVVVFDQEQRLLAFGGKRRDRLRLRRRRCSRYRQIDPD
jgi:hypothetical protein